MWQCERLPYKQRDVAPFGLGRERLPFVLEHSAVFAVGVGSDTLTAGVAPCPF